MYPIQEFSLLSGVVLLILGMILYVQDKAEHTESRLPGILYRFWFGKIGFRKPYSEIGEKWYHWDYLWGHLSWVLGRRELTFFWQRRTRGFDDSELWSLDDTIIKFILPRLKAFRSAKMHGYPGEIASDFGVPEDEEGHAGMSVWKGTIDKMIYSMEMWERTGGMPEIGDWDTYTTYNREESEANRRKYEEGMDLFHIYFHALWD